MEFQIIENSFAAPGISKDEEIVYLSFMQHHGLLTPLLGHTANPFVAKSAIDYNLANEKITTGSRIPYLVKKYYTEVFFYPQIEIAFNQS